MNDAALLPPGAIINETELKMNPGRSLLVPAVRTGAAAALLLLVAGCRGLPDLESASDPLVVTETGAAASMSSQQAAAVADMRAQGEAAQAAGYPQIFDAERTRRFAARDEPRPVADAEAIEAELAALAQRRELVTKPGEIAAMDARAAELRRLALQAGVASPLR